jgi:AcrR family transcriptional regulator
MQRLHSGRHRLTREEVASSQRGRLLFAIVQVVADKGYGPTTVADVVERAGVSRSTFYEQFPDKEACFLAAFDFGVEIVLGQMRTAAEPLEKGDWKARVRSDLETYLNVLATEPAFAWALHVRVLSAGPAALERRASFVALFSDRTRRAYEFARGQDRTLPELPPEAFLFHSGGVDELIRECLRTRGPEALPELTDPGVRATLALFGVRE